MPFVTRQAQQSERAITHPVRTMQTIKNLLSAIIATPHISPLEHRNTPRGSVGLLPGGTTAERKTANLNLTPDSGGNCPGAQSVVRKAGEELYLDRQTGRLSGLQVGEDVRVQRGETWQPAVVPHRHEQLRSFMAGTLFGGELTRKPFNLQMSRTST